ncbi:hypothetical protein CLG96_11720 [Sphingomonas oleivorans]|uniref:Uncharacterized protein n=1 Tax=Sphingomonas oleivorans TaxID=1735121 RepID=A0A2T5FVN8_9SPHN|nr:hypothetical protein [Sphingomonas oleivorans]PTQ09835.1 hypothetical protein CLG96_11720 [Sphingomonas oleivorans]
MAYRQFDDAWAIPALDDPPVAPAARPQCRFSETELRVLHLSRRDPLTSIMPAGPVRRMIGRLLGLAQAAPLADPRLESLRRLGILLRERGYAIAPSEIDRFVAAGFPLALVDEAYRLIGHGRRRF